MSSDRKSFIIKELKTVELPCWRAEHGAIEKVFCNYSGIFIARLPR